MSTRRPKAPAAPPTALGGIVDARVPLDQITPHPRNYRRHPPEQLRRLAASLIRFGQVRSIVVQDGPDGVYLCVAGHGVVEAARLIVAGEVAAPAARVAELGTLAARVVPATWTAEQVEGYLVADNYVERGAEDDEAELVALLREQQDAGFDLASLGADADALADLVAKLAPPSLDELERDYGDEPEPDAFWPVLRVRVPPEVKARWDALLAAAPGDSPHVKLACVLAAVDTAALAAVDPHAFDFAADAPGDMDDAGADD